MLVDKCLDSGPRTCIERSSIRAKYVHEPKTTGVIHTEDIGIKMDRTSFIKISFNCITKFRKIRPLTFHRPFGRLSWCNPYCVSPAPIELHGREVVASSPE